MKTTDPFKPGGRGVMATADASGTVNTAIYAAPRRIDENTVAWGMTGRRTYQNLRGNPNASYLYIDPGGGFQGVRLTLRLKEFADSGPLLEEIRENTRTVSSPAAADGIQYVAYFTIVETRPLV